MNFKTRKTPTGIVLQLVESYRNAQGRPRDRIVVSLGSADIPVQHRSAIAQIVKQELHGQTSLFNDASESVRQWADYVVRMIERQGRWRSRHTDTCQNKTGNSMQKTPDAAPPPAAVTLDGVLVNEVHHTAERSLGPSLVALHAWNELQMDQELERLGFNGSQRHAAAITVINRLVDPVSEHGILPWLATTALPELLGGRPDRPGDDRFYRVSDQLYKHRDKIERHIRQQQGTHFNLDRTILLYDLTNTHFEGSCENNPKAAYGKNKQGRDDCPQVVVGMVFDRDGFALAHKVFEGNRTDARSLVDMVAAMEQIVEKNDPQMVMGANKPLVIMDAGIATEKNLALLRGKGLSYLVNDRRRSRAEFREKFFEDGEFATIQGREVKPPVRVRQIELTHENDDGSTRTERVVLCKSEPRAAKERAIFSQVEERFLDRLKALSQRINAGRLKNTAKVNQAIGRLQTRHPKVQRYYSIEYHQVSPAVAGELRWTRNDEAVRNSQELCGCYVLRTDTEHLAADELWRLYISLTRAEDGFRYLKSDLGLRPNFHHLDRRVDAHIFITILAYQLLCFIQRSLERNGDNRCWTTIKRVLQTHCYATTVLPTRNGTVYRIRQAGSPDQGQRAIYDALGVKWVDLPRMRTVFSDKRMGSIL